MIDLSISQPYTADALSSIAPMRTVATLQQKFLDTSELVIYGIGCVNSAVLDSEMCFKDGAPRRVEKGTSIC